MLFTDRPSKALSVPNRTLPPEGFQIPRGMAKELHPLREIKVRRRRGQLFLPGREGGALVGAVRKARESEGLVRDRILNHNQKSYVGRRHASGLLVWRFQRGFRKPGI